MKIHFQNGAYIAHVEQQNPLIVFMYTHACTYRCDIVIGIAEQHSDVKWTITVTHSTVVIFNVVLLLLLLVRRSGKAPILNIFLQVGVHYPTSSALTGFSASGANLILSDRECRF